MRKILFFFFNVGILTLIPLYTYLYYKESVLSAFMISLSMVMMVAFLISLASERRICIYIRQATLFITITYCILELATWGALSIGLVRPDLRFFFGGFAAMDKNGFEYDSICGYRPTAGSRRYISIENGEAEIDHAVYANKNGWYSYRDYQYAKKDKRTKRYLVLGDSFSSGIAIETTWSDQVQQILSTSGNDSVELYNFSLDGAGIQNWHQIFFKEIVPHYEFDGIIIAASSENQGRPDFDRYFLMAESKENKTFMAFQDITAQAPPQSFPFAQAVPVLSITSNETIDKIKERYASKGGFYLKYTGRAADLHFLAILYGVSDGLHNFFILQKKTEMYQKSHASYTLQDTQAYKMECFDRRYKYAPMLKEILSYCHMHQKSVIITGIPDYDHALEYIRGKNCIYRTELKFLAEYYGASYFDGYQIFAKRDSLFVRSSYYQYDQHWNAKGASLFAEEIAKSNVFSHN